MRLTVRTSDALSHKTNNPIACQGRTNSKRNGIELDISFTYLKYQKNAAKTHLEPNLPRTIIYIKNNTA